MKKVAEAKNVQKKKNMKKSMEVSKSQSIEIEKIDQKVKPEEIEVEKVNVLEQEGFKILEQMEKEKLKVENKS